MTITPIAKAGRNAVAYGETVYDNLEVSVDDRIGEEGAGPPTCSTGSTPNGS